MATVQKITPCLWFPSQAQDAATFYTSIFNNSGIDHANPVVVNFHLEGQPFMALNGARVGFTDASSLMITCEGQEEVDRLWSRLTDGGQESQCGWLKDRFGVSWQVIPTALMRLMGDPNPAKAQAVVQAMLQMRKIDIAALERAHASA